MRNWKARDGAHWWMELGAGGALGLGWRLSAIRQKGVLRVEEKLHNGACGYWCGLCLCCKLTGGWGLWMYSGLPAHALTSDSLPGKSLCPLVVLGAKYWLHLDSQAFLRASSGVQTLNCSTASSSQAIASAVEGWALSKLLLPRHPTVRVKPSAGPCHHSVCDLEVVL